MNNSYVLLCESLNNDILYHGSSVQNLKILKPEKITFNNVKDVKRICATDSIKYAPTFTFKLKDGNQLDALGRSTYYSWREFTSSSNTLLIPKKYQSILTTAPCSIYILSKKDFSYNAKYNEFESFKSVEVIKEFKFKSVISALKNNGWTLKFTI